MSKELKWLSDLIVNSKYLSRWIVLAVDTATSVIATAMVCFGLSHMSPGWTISGSDMLVISCMTALLAALSYLFFGTYRGIMRHSSLQEMWRITASVVVKSTIMMLVALLSRHMDLIDIETDTLLIFYLMDIVLTAFVLILIRMFFIGIYLFFVRNTKKHPKRMFVFGSSQKSVSLISMMSSEAGANYKMLGFVDYSDKSFKVHLGGYPVYTISSARELHRLFSKTAANGIIFPDHETAIAHKDDLIGFCTSNGYQVMIMPKMNVIRKGDSLTSMIREINIEDLLGRSEIKVNMDLIAAELKGKTVMVTGAAGSIGAQLCRELTSFGIERLILVDMAETPLHNMQLELSDMETDVTFKYVLADVRSKERLEAIMKKYRPQLIFHAAAYKHVPMVENNPCEGVSTNVFGTKTVADLALKYDVERFVMVSTDKAVNPTNVMGATKRIAEIYVQSLGLAVTRGDVKGKTRFITTRFGNVLGSNGSVIPRFREQIIKGGPLTVTHKDIIRYFMTIPEACRLVLEAAYLGDGNRIFVFDMGKPVRIYDLAKNMIELAGFRPGIDIKIEVTGLRPGEKLYEELLNNAENTIPTENKQIFIAKAREYDYNDVLKAFEKLYAHSVVMDKSGTVREMKIIVPEFISNNSVYCEIDEELKNEKHTNYGE